MANKEVFAEDKVGHKIDRCFSDAVIKFGEHVKQFIAEMR
jgi:hypothetical protein